MDVYLDVVCDLTCHPHYVSLATPPSGRVRGRSVPTHRLNMDLAENLTLEPESVMEPAREDAEDAAVDRSEVNDYGWVIYFEFRI